MHLSTIVSRIKLRIITCLLFIDRKGGVGYYALCGQAPEKTISARVRCSKGEGNLPEIAIRSAGWSYDLNTMCYYRCTRHYNGLVPSENSIRC